MPHVPRERKSHDVKFHLGVAPYSDAEIFPREKELVYASAYLDENEKPVLRIWKAADETYLRLDYCDGTRFWLDRSREQLWAIWPEHLTLENALCYLLGPVFGLLLRLRGVTCWHASAWLSTMGRRLRRCGRGGEIYNRSGVCQTGACGPV